MRPLTDTERTLLLHTPAVTVTAGLELLDANLNVIEDASAALRSEGSSVARSMNATVHGTCTVELGRELAWGTGLVRLYQVLTDDQSGLSARFDLGAFVLLTPQRPVGGQPASFNTTGWDRLYLLDREVGDAYAVDAGTSYVTAIRQAFADAGLTGVDIDATAEGRLLPQPRVWPLIPAEGQPTTWLRIVNDLADAINYRGVWADETGRFRTGPYVDPASRPIDLEITADDGAIVLPERRVTEQLWRQPNYWVFVQANRDAEPTEGDGVYIVDRTSGSPLVGGLRWARQVNIDAADQAALEAIGDRMVADDTRSATHVQFALKPFPAAGHADIYRYLDRDAVGDRRVQVSNWDLDLATGRNEMTVEVIG